MRYDLHGKKMNAVETAETGLINSDTIFEFSQVGNQVTAVYSGGHIRHGFLVGIIDDDKFRFRYCQMTHEGELDGGESNCELEVRDGLVRVLEHFKWESRPGSGTNVIQELAG